MESLLNNHPEQTPVKLWVATRALESNYEEAATMKQECNNLDEFGDST